MSAPAPAAGAASSRSKSPVPVAARSSGAASGRGQISAATYGKIDSVGVATPSWLTRIPPKLARAWEDAPEGTVLGTFTFTKGSPPVVYGKGGAKANGASKAPRVEQSISVSVSQALASANPELPETYTIEGLTRKVPVLYPFTRRPDGSIDIHSAVAKTGSLQMSRTDKYSNLCRNRLVASATADRFVQPVSVADLATGGLGGRKRPGAAVTAGGGTSGSKSGGGFGDSVRQFGKAIIDAAASSQLDPDRKRKFAEDQSIRSILFELFSTQSYWAVRDLRNACGRGEKEIREALVELADFHRSGENKGTWELREEFRQGVTATAPPSSSSAGGTGGGGDEAAAGEGGNG